MYRRALIALLLALLPVLGLAAPSMAAGAASSTTGSVDINGAATAATTASSVTTVGLGDSVPSGYGCNCQNYVTGAGIGVAAHHHGSANVRNFAVAGYTSGQVVYQAGGYTVTNAIRSARLVIITAGANDFPLGQLTSASCMNSEARCYASQLNSMAANLTTIVRRVRQVNPNATVLVTDYFNVFWDGAVGRSRGSAYVRGSDVLTRDMNARIRGVAVAQHAHYLDMYHLFKGASGTADDTRLLSDGMHPNAAGHALITRAILNLFY